MVNLYGNYLTTLAIMNCKILLQVMLCFSRDTEVLSIFNHSASNPVHAILKNKPSAIENTVVFPPSGIIPFHGFTMYGT